MDILYLLRESRLQTWELKHQLWQQGFLTFNWWFIAITIAVSYAIWWKYTDKRRIIELLLYGSFVAVTRVLFDAWGITSGRWTYTLDLVPGGISLFLNDLTIVPLFLMLAYQYSPNWKTFFVWLIVVEGLVAFALLPLLSYLGILKLHAWRYYGSFIYVVTAASIMRAIMLFGLNLQEKSRAKAPKPSSTTLVAEPALKLLHNPKDDNEGR